MKKLIYVFLGTVQYFQGCKSVHVFSENDLVKFIANSKTFDTSRLSSNGFFNDEMSASHLFGQSKNPEIIKAKNNNFFYIGNFFFKNKMVYLWNIMRDRNEEVRNYKSVDTSYFYSHLEGWGLYKIKADTLEVLYYRKFQNRFKLPRWDLKLVKYQGIILNNTTIINWRQIPPYPNNESDQIDTIPRTLNFVEFYEKNFIDTSKSLFYKRYKNIIVNKIK